MQKNNITLERVGRDAAVLNIVVIDALLNDETGRPIVNVIQSSIEEFNSNAKLRNILATTNDDTSCLARIYKEWFDVSLKLIKKPVRIPKVDGMADEIWKDKVRDIFNHYFTSPQFANAGFYFADTAVSVVSRKGAFYIFDAIAGVLTIGTAEEIASLLATSRNQRGLDVDIVASRSRMDIAADMSGGVFRPDEKGIKLYRHVLNRNYTKLKSLDQGDTWGTNFYKSYPVRKSILWNRYTYFSNPYKSLSDVVAQCLMIIISPLYAGSFALAAVLNIISAVIFLLKFLYDVAYKERPVEHLQDAGVYLLESFGLLCAAPFTPLLLTAGLINRAIVTRAALDLSLPTEQSGMTI